MENYYDFTSHSLLAFILHDSCVGEKFIVEGGFGWSDLISLLFHFCYSSCIDLLRLGLGVLGFDLFVEPVLFLCEADSVVKHGKSEAVHTRLFIVSAGTLTLFA